MDAGINSYIEKHKDLFKALLFIILMTSVTIFILQCFSKFTIMACKQKQSLRSAYNLYIISTFVTLAGM